MAQAVKKTAPIAKRIAKKAVKKAAIKATEFPTKKAINVHLIFCPITLFVNAPAYSTKGKDFFAGYLNKKIFWHQGGNPNAVYLFGLKLRYSINNCYIRFFTNVIKLLKYQLIKGIGLKYMITYTLYIYFILLPPI